MITKMYSLQYAVKAEISYVSFIKLQDVIVNIILQEYDNKETFSEAILFIWLFHDKFLTLLHANIKYRKDIIAII